MSPSTSMPEINASEVVGTGFPTDEGKKLAEQILAGHDNLDGLTVDVSNCADTLLISAFFNAFLQHVSDQAKEKLEAARKITWVALFSFQNENIETWMKDFQPHTD